MSKCHIVGNHMPRLNYGLLDLEDLNEQVQPYIAVKTTKYSSIIFANFREYFVEGGGESLWIRP